MAIKRIAIPVREAYVYEGKNKFPEVGNIPYKMLEIDEHQLKTTIREDQMKGTVVVEATYPADSNGNFYYARAEVHPYQFIDKSLEGREQFFMEVKDKVQQDLLERMASGEPFNPSQLETDEYTGAKKAKSESRKEWTTSGGEFAWLDRRIEEVSIPL